MSGALTGEAAARLVRGALETGDMSMLAAAHGEGALLECAVAGERSFARGPAEIGAALARVWPGRARVVEWRSTPGPGGCAVWSERVSEDGSARRQRQYVKIEGGEICRHWLFGAPPRSGAPELGGGDPLALFERLRVRRREPLVSTGWSGNRLERLITADGEVLVAKRVEPSADWIGRNSGDHGREALLFTEGAFQRMSAIDPAVVAAEPDGDRAWWIVMRDVSGALLDGRSPITREQNRVVMRAANSMWEEFWGESHDFLCDQAARIGFAAPRVAERERNAMDLLPKQFEAGWDALAEAIDKEVGEATLALLDDVASLSDEIASYGTTLLHGDLRDEQIGFGADTLIALDWGLATQGNPVVDLAWYMVHDVWRIEATHDEVVDDFRRARGDHDDPRAVELLGLVGLLMYGWIFGICAGVHTDPAEQDWAYRELAWWVPRARHALERWPT